MTLRTTVRNPLVATMLGAVLGAAPLGALYTMGVAPKTARARTPRAADVTSVEPVAGTAVLLPDFTPLVKKYGPAVVNIRVIEKAGGSEQARFPTGPNRPFSPFFFPWPSFPRAAAGSRPR